MSCAVFCEKHFLILRILILPPLLSVLVPRVAGAFIPVKDVSRARAEIVHKESFLDHDREESFVLFAITSSNKPEFAIKRQACLETWAASIPANRLMIVGASPTIKPLAIWEPALNCLDTHEGGACKDSTAITRAAELQPSWLVLVGDDNYVCVSNIESELAKHNPDDPVIFGVKGCGAENCSIGGLCGGGGQIFSRAMIQRMVHPNKASFMMEHDQTSSTVGMWGDVASCVVAAHHGGRIDGSILGFHGWSLNQADLAAAIKSVRPLPLTFHYMDPIAMRMTHAMLLKAQTTQQIGEKFLGFRESPDFNETFIERRARYVAEENERRKLSRKVRPA
eukprot:TRINITY_DN12075_c0_g2_i1.p1 TRINITY_DN12075_c0_g2~~TRINITY_DN12075_c0_g2_i1.p1  ORF type:complete len:337 (+),score=49.85 TRINITY_DN12075_c0_g2_i1:60-1070(+)